MRYIGSTVYLLAAVLEGFLVVMVVCGNGGCQEEAPTTTANYLACSLLLALYKRYPGARKWGKEVGQGKPKKWEIELFWQYDFPLAGTPRDLWVVGIYSSTCVCAANKTCGLCATLMGCFQHIHMCRFGGVGGQSELGGSPSPK